MTQVSPQTQRALDTARRYGALPPEPIVLEPTAVDRLAQAILEGRVSFVAFENRDGDTGYRVEVFGE